MQEPHAGLSHSATDGGHSSPLFLNGKLGDDFGDSLFDRCPRFIPLSMENHVGGSLFGRVKRSVACIWLVTVQLSRAWTPPDVF